MITDVSNLLSHVASLRHAMDDWFGIQVPVVSPHLAGCKHLNVEVVLTESTGPRRFSNWRWVVTWKKSWVRHHSAFWNCCPTTYLAYQLGRVLFRNLQSIVSRIRYPRRFKQSHRLRFSSQPPYMMGFRIIIKS